MSLYIGVSRGLTLLDGQKTKSLVKKQKGFCKSCGYSLGKGTRGLKGDNVIQDGAYCKMCFYTMAMDKIPNKNKGKIILMPHLTQVEVNNLMKVIWFLERNSDEYEEEADAAGIISELLNQNASLSNQYYSGGASNVDLLIQLFFSVTEEQYANRRVGAMGLRWLPIPSIFADEMGEWENKEFKKFPVSKWKPLILKVAKMKEGNE